MEKQQPPFTLGIDLGTTHSVVALTMLDDEAGTSLLPIPQLTAPGTLEENTQLPSFLYLAHPDEINGEALSLPWPAPEAKATGMIAKRLGSKTPLRLVSSAKSWLCHDGVDRHAAFLPVNDLEDVDRVSPVEATRLYLQHLKSALLYHYPELNLSNQPVTLTIPASFDPAARELTAETAKKVGFQKPPPARRTPGSTL